MIKKISMFLLLIMVIGMSPSVFAEDTNNFVDAETINEIRAFNTTQGAEIRLIQLEKSITRNLLSGTKVVDVIKTNHLEIDTNNIEQILNKLEILLNEAKNYTLEEKDHNTLALDFVAMKKSAITLTQEFKSLTTNILTVEERQQIQEEIKSTYENELNQIQEKISTKIRTHNAQKIQNMLGNMDLNKPYFIQQIMDGNMTKQQIGEQIRKNYQDLNQFGKTNAWKKIKEQSNKRIILEKSLINQAQNKGFEKYNQLQNQMNQNLHNWINDNNNLTEQRMQRIHQTIDSIIQKTKNYSNGRN